MRSQLPDPLKLPWELRENLTARSGVDQLDDGRTKYWVDEVLKGITPEMFVWWFSGGILGDKGRTSTKPRLPLDLSQLSPDFNLAGSRPIWAFAGAARAPSLGP